MPYQTSVTEQAFLKKLGLSWHLTLGPISRSETSVTEQSLKKLIFIHPTDAHNYKITSMLKQLNFPQLLRNMSEQLWEF